MLRSVRGDGDLPRYDLAFLASVSSVTLARVGSPNFSFARPATHGLMTKSGSLQVGARCPNIRMSDLRGRDLYNPHFVHHPGTGRRLLPVKIDGLISACTFIEHGEARKGCHRYRFGAIMGAKSTPSLSGGKLGSNFKLRMYS